MNADSAGGAWVPETDGRYEDALQRELHDLTHYAVHALRTPLWTTLEFARMLDEEAGELSPSARESLGNIRKSAERASVLLNGLAALDAASASPCVPQRVDLSEVVRQAAATLFAEESFRVAIEGAVIVHADPRLIARAVACLLENARKYTRGRPAPCVEFGVNRADGQSACFVRDNGVGFDPALSYKLFKPFQRLHPSEQYDGLGMGLAIVQRVIHRHGGRVWAEGAPNRGATVWFTLPSCGEEPEAKRPS